MGSGSDHMAFLQRAGIPCVDQKVGRPKVSILVSCFIDFSTNKSKRIMG